ncbi:GNAT family N-acetyltransferase [Pseudomonas sp. CVAP|uniref:GNAT family N-acetyltransferase n=1 Tax=Pseudomonas sp. CVAP\|nr:GNAT family N-acetyltransferase [Pseudomonas sp. CVAP\
MTLLNDHQGSILVKLATTKQEKEQAYQLRYEIFSKKDIFSIPETNHSTHMESDIYDTTCEHLIALDKSTGLVVGTLRFQTAHTAVNAHGFFADNEYDTQALRTSKKTIIEIGRLCINEHYKAHNIFLLFWKSLTTFINTHFTAPVYIIGLCSVPYTNHHEISTIHYLLQSKSTFNDFAMDAFPERRFLINPRGISTEDAHHLTLPKLLRVYLSAGAQLLGMPAQDTREGNILAVTFPLLSRFQAR